MIKSIENHNLENLLNPLANVTNFGSLFCRIRYCWDLGVEHSHGLKMSSHEPFSLNASPLSWTQYDSCHAELRRWVFSTASITRVTLVWSSWCCDFRVWLIYLSILVVFKLPWLPSQDCCTVSTPLQLCLHYVSSAAFCQLSCNLSALAYSVICCDRPAARHQLSFEVQGSSANCHLSCNLSARSWHVSLAAVCQLSLSVQLQHSSSAAICQLSSTAIWQLSCNSSTQLSAQLQHVSSAATCQLSCTLSV